MAKDNSEVDRTLDWRDRASYEHIDFLSDRGWAWEGLRRNRDFQAAWHAASTTFDVHDAGRGIKVVRPSSNQNSLGHWGILYSDPPHVHAGYAAVVWRAESVHTLHAVALPVEGLREGAPFNLGNARCSILVVQTLDGSQHVLFHRAQCSVQLTVRGVNVLKPMCLLIDAAPDTDVKGRWQTLAQFDELRTEGKCESIKRIAKGRAGRSRLVLQALDGFLEDASLREIAVALFGAERVECDWDDDRRHLKDRVRRAVARGRWLMDGGYRKYLK